MCAVACSQSRASHPFLEIALSPFSILATSYSEQLLRGGNNASFFGKLWH
jgi:hypothetical protein